MRSLAVLLLVVTACSTPRLADRELPPRPPSLRAAFEQMPAPATARVRVLSENTDAWAARWRTIEAAAKTVDVQYFIIEPDAYGLSLLGLLLEKQIAGATVRLMVDSRGTPGLTREFMGIKLLRDLADAGAEVRIYNPIETNVADAIASGDLRTLAASNHDKLVIVDKRVAVTGGRNISKDYLSDPRDLPGAYIDMDIFVEGETAAAALTEAFTSELKGTRAVKVDRGGGEEGRQALLCASAAMRLWLTDPAFTEEEIKALDDPAKREALALVYEGNVVAKLDYIPQPKAREVLRTLTRQLATLPHLRGALSRPVPNISAEPQQVRVLDTHSAEGPDTRNRVNENLLAAIQAAEHEVVIQSPYFVLTNRGMRAMEAAAARGVQITILTNSPTSSDSAITQAAFLLQWPELLARVKTARLFVIGEKRLMHAKVGVMDSQLAFVGSYNLDPLSMGVNGEVVTAAWSEDLAGKERALILGRIAQGPPNVVEYRIKRDDKGEVVRDDKSLPVVVYGPDDHCDKDALARVRRLNPVLELLAPLI